ncbi:MAG: helix-hairpin-helix domain-containing protein [Flavobacteriales bacterium]|nr:helix-hairpin-helix domain-containing protein [Flavobacteriales bacterium]
MKAFAAAAAMLAGGVAWAQVDRVPRDVIEQRIEAAAEQLGGDAEVDLTNLFELLTDRYTDPIDLNNATAEDLNALLLLTDVQVSALLQHIRRNGKLLSLYELQAINSWDATTINLVRPFITVRENALATRAFAEGDPEAGRPRIHAAQHHEHRIAARIHGSPQFLRQGLRLLQRRCAA